MAIDPKTPSPRETSASLLARAGEGIGKLWEESGISLPKLPAGVQLAPFGKTGADTRTAAAAIHLPSLTDGPLDFYSQYAQDGYLMSAPSQRPNYFGTLFTEGDNPDQTALLTFAAISYTHTNLWPDATEEQKAALLNRVEIAQNATLQALAQHFPDATPEELTTKLADFENALKKAKTDGTTLTDALPEALKTLGVTLRGGAMDEAEALRKREEEARAQMIANAKAAADGKGAEAVTPPAEPVAGTLDDKTFEKVCSALDKTFDTYAATKRFPEVSHDQRVLVKAVFLEEMTRAQNFGRDYVVSGAITGGLEYAGAILGATGTIYQEAKAAFIAEYGTKEEWTEAFKNGASAGWKTIREKAGDTFANEWQAASQQVTARQLREIRENAAFAIGKTENHAMRANSKLSLETLTFIHKEAPNLYAQLTGSTTAPDASTKVTYGALVDLFENDTSRYANVATNTDGGKGDQVPISIAHNADAPYNAMYNEPLAIADSAKPHFMEKGLMVDNVTAGMPPARSAGYSRR